MQHIGLYGGSFDPIHSGHLLVARAAREELALDGLYFVPAALSPFKIDGPRTAGDRRLQMLRLALAGWTACAVDDQELRRGGVSYTIDTVRDYAGRFPGAELFYLIGADNVALLPRWRDAAELARLAEFVVIPRPGEAEVAAPAPFRVRRLQGVPAAISSSLVRERVRQGLPVDHLTPPAVAEAIRNNHLYL
jgi:nicotinate-nucleotide adenylyltransferase